MLILFYNVLKLKFFKNPSCVVKIFHEGKTSGETPGHVGFFKHI